MRIYGKSAQSMGSPKWKQVLQQVLGGVLLKQALCMANAQLHRYEYLVNTISGIVFFSTPHLGQDRGETFEKTISTIRATTKAASKAVSKLPSLNVEEEAASLFDLSVRFEAADLHSPVLSVYELVPTKIQEGRFKSKKMIDLVDMRRWDTATYSPTYSERSSISFDRIRQETVSGRPETSEHISNSNEATYASSTAHETLTHVVSALNIREREPQLPCKILNTEYHDQYFFGREDVLSLIGNALLPSKDKMISSESEGLRQFAICGMGGLGKTEIATEFAVRSKDLFDGVFWIPADDPAKLDAAFSLIAKQLGLEDPADSKNHIVSRELVKGWLSRPWKMTTIEGNATPTTATWLIIFDNADDQYTLTDYWPLQSNGSVLITSRDPLAKSYFTANPSAGVDLEPLSKAEGASLLYNMTALRDGDQAHVAERIAELLGGVPLAISQMAGVIRRQELRLSEFLESYEDASEQGALHKSKYPIGKTNYPHDISTVWAFESLDTATSSLLSTLALLDPDSIPEFLFADIPTSLSLDKFPTKSAAYRKARTDLLQASLVKRHADQNELIIHRLVQDSFKAQMEQPTKVHAFWFTVGLIALRWPTTMPPPTKKTAPVTTHRMWNIDRWPMCEALYPHAMKLKQYYEEMGSVELGKPPLYFPSLLQNAALWQFERGRTHEVIKMLQLALDMLSMCTDEDKGSVFVDTHFALGAVTAGTNDHDQSVYHHQCALRAQLEMRWREDVLDTRLARCYNELGTGRMEGGDLSGSIEAFLESMRIDKELGVYPWNWVMEANLGLSYTYIGNMDEAEVVLVGTLDRREAKFGKNDTESYRPGRILHALARLREAQGRAEEAFQLYSRSLASLMATLGHHHHFSADCGHKVTQYAIKYGQYENALFQINRPESLFL
ncbi:hypothetical protein ACLMJK_006135 [Lecanora helva]